MAAVDRAPAGALAYFALLGAALDHAAGRALDEPSLAPRGEVPLHDQLNEVVLGRRALGTVVRVYSPEGRCALELAAALATRRGQVATPPDFSGRYAGRLSRPSDLACGLMRALGWVEI